MKDSIPFDVETQYGHGILEQLYLTELGYVMARIYYPEKSVWINYNLSDIQELVKGSSIEIKSKTVHKKEEILELS